MDWRGCGQGSGPREVALCLAIDGQLEFGVVAGDLRASRSVAEKVVYLDNQYYGRTISMLGQAVRRESSV